jgi:hypothetical protein
MKMIKGPIEDEALFISHMVSLQVGGTVDAAPDGALTATVVAPDEHVEAVSRYFSGDVVVTDVLEAP